MCFSSNVRSIENYLPKKNNSRKVAIDPIISIFQSACLNASPAAARPRHLRPQTRRRPPRRPRPPLRRSAVVARPQKLDLCRRLRRLLIPILTSAGNSRWMSALGCCRQQTRFSANCSGYTESNMSEYLTQWQDYRRRKKLLFFAFFGYIPACAVFYVVAMQLFHSDRFLQPFAICWMVFFAFAFVRFSAFQCPRCGNKYFIRRRFAFFSDYRILAQECVHCDLPKYS